MASTIKAEEELHELLGERVTPDNKERIPPEYAHLRIDSATPDLKRHPDQCYLLCGQPGAGKSAVMWATP